MTSWRRDHPELVLEKNTSSHDLLVHLHGHLNYHLGQIDYLRRILTEGSAVAFAGLSSRFVYLHGFASSPSSRKARFFQERFRELGIGLEVPDLAEGDFRNLTITGQLQVIERVCRDEPVSLIGSSMGGYLAALYAARHAEVKKVVLMAPAFSFATRWPETLGEEAMEQWKRTNTLRVFHYAEGREVELGYQLIEDAHNTRLIPTFTPASSHLSGAAGYCGAA